MFVSSNNLSNATFRSPKCLLNLEICIQYVRSIRVSVRSHRNIRFFHYPYRWENPVICAWFLDKVCLSIVTNHEFVTINWLFNFQHSKLSNEEINTARTDSQLTIEYKTKLTKTYYDKNHNFTLSCVFLVSFKIFWFNACPQANWIVFTN